MRLRPYILCPILSYYCFHDFLCSVYVTSLREQLLLLQEFVSVHVAKRMMHGMHAQYIIDIRCTFRAG